ESREVPCRNTFDVGANSQVRRNVLAKTLDHFNPGLFDLDLQAQFVHFAEALNLNCEFNDLRVLPDNILHGAGKHVHATDRDHIVCAAKTPSHQARPKPAAAARFAGQNAEITGPITDDRHSNASEVCQHQLPFEARLDRRKCFGIDDLCDELILVDMK